MLLGGVVVAAVVVATLPVNSLRLRRRRLWSPCVSIRPLVVVGRVCRQVDEARLLPHEGAVAPGQVRRRYPLRGCPPRVPGGHVWLLLRAVSVVRGLRPPPFHRRVWLCRQVDDARVRRRRPEARNRGLRVCVRRARLDVRLRGSSGLAAARHGKAKTLHRCPRPRCDALRVEQIAEEGACRVGPAAGRGRGSGDVDFDQLVVADGHQPVVGKRHAVLVNRVVGWP